MNVFKQRQLFSPAVLSIAFVVSFGFFSEAKAICNSTACLNGYIDCLAWCGVHNKTSKSDGACSVRCGDYWHDGASLKSPSQPNPSGPPRYVGPGRVNDPPIVSDPTAPRRPITTAKPTAPFKPVGNSNPNGPQSGASNPVIYERNSGGNQSGGHESGGGGGHGR